MRIEQAPNPDSRVTLSRQVGAFGLPWAHLHWALRSRDKRTMRVAATTFGAELRGLGLGELELAPWFETADLAFPGSMVGAHHHMGATRMSAEPTKGVVDANCRAHGTPPVSAREPRPGRCGR